MSRPYYRLLILILVVFSGIGLASPDVYLYLIKFENIKNDPGTEWLRTGFTDMVSEFLSDEEGVHIRGQDELEKIMNNRNLLLHQPRGSKNFLLLGKYDRSLDEIQVRIQLINIANWEEVGARKISGSYNEIPALGKNLATVVKALLSPYLPKKKKTAGIYPKFVTPPPTPKTDFAAKGAKLTKSIDVAIDLLEESMDLAIGAREKPPERPEGAEGEWELDLNVDNEFVENPENSANTEMLMRVLDNLTKTPYQIRLSKPKFEYNQDNDSIMNVIFPVTYSLKENIIKDMLTTLPYSGLKQDGSLTIFYFNKDKFNFPDEMVDKIRYGNYRSVPVIQFFNEDGDPVVVIVDTPEMLPDLRLPENVHFITTHYFSPLIDFTLGGWSMQIAMESVDIPVKYQFTIGIDDVKELSRIRLKFVPLKDLQSFLNNIL